MITASEKKDSATRQIITAPPNRPTFPNNSLNVIISSCDSSRISTYVEQTDGGTSSVEQTGGDNKSTRVLIPHETGAATFVRSPLSGLAENAAMRGQVPASRFDHGDSPRRVQRAAISVARCPKYKWDYLS